MRFIKNSLYIAPRLWRFAERLSLNVRKRIFNDVFAIIKITNKTKILLGENNLNFNDFFYNIGIRMGSHDPKGFIIIPDKMNISKSTYQIYTHQLFFLL